MFLDASPRLALGGPAHGGSAVVYRLITSLLFAMRRGGSGVGDLGTVRAHSVNLQRPRVKEPPGRQSYRPADPG